MLYWGDEYGYEYEKTLAARRRTYAEKLKAKYPHLDRFQIKRIAERKIR
jgi:hypothetical protein